jgi:dTDP-4-amino-4,6-dideoxygalactose transaminase
MKKFSKPFTQQEAIPEDAIKAAVSVLETGRLHRYNTAKSETAETALWEAEYAAYQGSKYCLATSSGGAAMQIALRASGLKHGEKVLTNAFTLAPVPGAIAAAGGVPIFVETNENLTIDLKDLDQKLAHTGSKLLMLSHMRGHLAPMDELVALTNKYDAKIIEDCAHTMGAEWRGKKSGNFGIAACFSTQTYKHLNSGEGGLLTTDDDELMARAVILSGSYMLYEKHGARPDMDAFAEARFEMPNCSSRMDNLRAAILRPQLKQLEENIERWNARYRLMEDYLSKVEGITMPHRPNEERYVASSLQFLTPQWTDEKCRAFVAACLSRGVELKWFGDKNPVGFTSRFDSWRYAPEQKLDKTITILNRVFDMRIPLIFTEDDCGLIAEIIAEEFKKVA